MRPVLALLGDLFLHPDCLNEPEMAQTISSSTLERKKPSSSHVLLTHLINRLFSPFARPQHAAIYLPAHSIIFFLHMDLIATATIDASLITFTQSRQVKDLLTVTAADRSEILKAIQEKISFLPCQLVGVVLKNSLCYQAEPQLLQRILCSQAVWKP